VLREREKERERESNTHARRERKYYRKWVNFWFVDEQLLDHMSELL
jgi:hypothetical protein